MNLKKQRLKSNEKSYRKKKREYLHLTLPSRLDELQFVAMKVLRGFVLLITQQNLEPSALADMCTL